MATFQAGTLDDDGVFHPIAGAVVGDTEDEARHEAQHSDEGHAIEDGKLYDWVWDLSVRRVAAVSQ